MPNRPKHSRRSKHRATKQITQAELKRYVEKVDLCREHQRHSDDLRRRLDDGASVEDGEFSLEICVEYARSWSLDHVAEVIGRKQAQELWKSIGLSPVRRMRVRDNDGNIVGWQPRRTASHAEELPPRAREGDTN